MEIEEIKTKICTKCKEEKDISQFGKSKNSRDGLRNCCKNCRKQYQQENKEHIKKYLKNYNIKNKEEIREKNKIYRENNKEIIKERKKEYYLKNKEKIKKEIPICLKEIEIDKKICSKCKDKKNINEFKKDKTKKDGLYSSCKLCVKKYQQENKEKIIQSSKRYYLKNKENLLGKRKDYHKQYAKENGNKIKEYRNIYERERRKNDPIFRLRKIVSCSVRTCLKRFNSSKKDSCLKHLPYTIQQLYDHLEKQFDLNMSWSNYGLYWDIDHIIPQSLLPYDSMEHPNFQKCWALSNLRPLEHMENLRKGNKLIS